MKTLSKCKICGKEFNRIAPSQKCCSKECSTINQKLNLKKWNEKHGKVKKPKGKYSLTPQQVEQREKMKLELLRRRLMREVIH